MASLDDEQLEKMIHEISTMGSQLAKAEATYEKLVNEMKHEKDLAFINLKDTKMTLKEKEAIANTQPEVIGYFKLKLSDDKPREKKSYHSVGDNFKPKSKHMSEYEKAKYGEDDIPF